MIGWLRDCGADLLLGLGFLALATLAVAALAAGAVALSTIGGLD